MSSKSSTNTNVLLAAAAAGGALLGFLGSRLFKKPKRQDGAHVLLVQMKLKKGTARQFFDNWKHLADSVEKNESNCMTVSLQSAFLSFSVCST